jgi:glycine cleavage system H lipoate-binding protein
MVAVFVLSVFFLILLIDLAVLKYQGKTHPAFEPVSRQYILAFFDENNITIPSAVFFSKGHTWLKKNSEGLIELGIDLFGTEALGQISILKCAEAGKELKRGAVLFEGIYGNKAVKFLSPVNGVVKSVNPAILGSKIADPYKTWGVQMTSENFDKNRKLFSSGDKALLWMKEEYVRLNNFISSLTSNTELAGVTMYDGGTLSDDIASLSDDKSIKNFEKEFLSL